MFRPAHLLLLLCALLLASGCSGPAPQRIHLQPEVITTPRLPSAVPLQVEVVYPHRKLKLGTVADRLGNETIVSVTDDLSAEIRAALIDGLRRMGVQAPSANASTRLTVTIEEMTYHLRSDGLRRELIGTLKLRMQASDGRRHYRGEFAQELREEVLTTPTEVKSREFLNQLASQVLTEALNDPEFTRYLIQGSL